MIICRRGWDWNWKRSQQVTTLAKENNCAGGQIDIREDSTKTANCGRSDGTGDEKGYISNVAANGSERAFGLTEDSEQVGISGIEISKFKARKTRISADLKFGSWGGKHDPRARPGVLALKKFPEKKLGEETAFGNPVPIDFSPPISEKIQAPFAFWAPSAARKASTVAWIFP